MRTPLPTLLLLIVASVVGHASAAPRANARGGATDGPPPAGAAAQLRRIETPYYVLHTDVDDDTAREAAVRVTAMAEEYHRRTREFSGAVRQRMPFYLFRRPADYHAAGGREGSDGVFDGTRLMAVAGDRATAATWHVTQHEGFHQFAHAVIGGQLPMWVNEGLAEYFGEGAFTGDGYETGLVPPWRLRRIKAALAAEKFKPAAELMSLTNAEWNAELAIENYDQAWTMVHFLAHGGDGRYQQPFVRFMKDLARGRDAAAAWQATFGSAAGDFERAWRAYWRELPDDPTADLYAKATAATLTSFYARAAAQRQTFDSADAFLAAAQAAGLKSDRAQFLPPALLAKAVKDAPGHGTWSLETLPDKSTRLVCTRPDGTRLAGTFALKLNKVDRVEVTTDDTARVLAAARSLTASGDVAKAKPLLIDALKRNPKSPLADEVRKLLQPPPAPTTPSPRPTPERKPR